MTNAQPSALAATVSAGVTQDNTYAAIGQPFIQHFGSDDDSLQFGFGIAQAQITRDTVYDVATFEAPYTDNGYNLPSQTSSYKDSVYTVNGGIHYL